MTRLFLALVACLCLFACPYQPPRPPTPDAGSGGVAATGGYSATGGAQNLAGSSATGGYAATGGASALTPEQQACANELALGCPEGTKPTCATDMVLRCSNPKVKCNTPCIVAAKTKSELQTKCFVACGSL